jgi:hypothetical protein
MVNSIKLARTYCGGLFNHPFTIMTSEKHL